MYTSLENYQIIISLLKQNNIRHLVLSAGTRNIPFVQSVENDPFFICYSVVDERSAAYMALGLSLRLNEPVVISCTSSTATCNYFPAIAEAFHQKAQLIVLTSDRNPALLGQREDQMINQVSMYGSFVKKSVNLPIVNTKEDFWFCERLVNEAIMATYIHGKGPVQINIPMLSYSTRCTLQECLTARKITYYNIESSEEKWKECVMTICSKRRIMLICGQMNKTSKKLNELIKAFSSCYNAVVLAEYMANIEYEEAINPFLPFDTHVISNNAFEQYVPDLVISIGGNVMSGIKSLLRNKSGRFEHWGIEESGDVVDMYKSQTKLFECSPEYFLQYFIQSCALNGKRDDKYLQLIRRYSASVQIPAMHYSNNSAISSFVKRMPDNSLLHLSINNSIRLVNYFGLPNRSIKVYANIGTHGIDGCLSSFIGQAITTENLSFLIIGDLSFFYDMGAMRIKHIPNTARMLMINNHGGGEFHYSTTLRNDPTMDLHTSAAHDNIAEGWVKSVGFEYIPVHECDDYEKVLDVLFDVNRKRPVFIEFFSDMEKDATTTHLIENSNRITSGKEKTKEKITEMAHKILNGETIEKVKRLLR